MTKRSAAKKIIAIVSAISALPAVYANTSTQQAINIISSILGNTESLEQALLKVMLWTIIFTAFFTGTKTVLTKSDGTTNKAAAIVVSMIMATLAARYMQTAMLESLGIFIVITGFLVVPYMIIVKWFLKGWSKLKWIVLGATYVGLFVFFIAGRFLSISRGLGWELFEDISWYLWYKWGPDNEWIVAIVVIVLIMIIYGWAKKNHKKEKA